MKSEAGTLLTLAAFFALTSLFAIGGANSAIPEIHRFAVDVQHWLSDRQFADSFALAQLTPGPNLIIVTLISYRVGGVATAIVATLAMCAALRDCLSGRPHRRALQGCGLAWRDQPRPYWVAGVVTLTTAVTAFSMRLHPLWAFAVAALLGAVGVI